MLLVFGELYTSVTITEERQTLDTFGNVWQNIKYHPIYQILSLYVVTYLIILIFDVSITRYSPFLLLLIMFLPLIPTLVIEHLWAIKLQEAPQLAFAKEKTDSLRTHFLFFGTFFSVFYFFLAKIQLLIIGTAFFSILNNYTELRVSSNDVVVTFTGFLLFYLLVGLSSVVAMYKLNLINFTDMTENTDIKRFYNHPMILTTQLSYFFIGSMLVPIVVYPFRLNSDQINVASLLNKTDLQNFPNNLLFGYGYTLPLLFLFPLFILIIFSVHGKYSPYIFRGRIVDKRNTSILQQWIILILGFVLLFAFFTYQMLQISSSLSFEIIFDTIMITSVIITTYFIYTSFIVDTLCENCGYFGGESCIYCNNSEEFSFSSFINAKLKPPICPNCKETWDTLSRACSNCQYTIVLICENCSATINPLWRKCNLCGSPRQPIPNVALKPLVDTRYNYVRARYITFLLLVLPIAMTEIAYVIHMYVSYNNYLIANPINNGVTIFLFFIADNIKHLLIWFIAVISMVIVLYKTSINNQNSKLLILDEFFQLSFSEMIVMAILFALYFLVKISLSFSRVLFPFILLVGLLALILFIRYRNLRKYETFTITLDKNGGIFS